MNSQYCKEISVLVRIQCFIRIYELQSKPILGERENTNGIRKQRV